MLELRDATDVGFGVSGDTDESDRSRCIQVEIFKRAYRRLCPAWLFQEGEDEGHGEVRRLRRTAEVRNVYLRLGTQPTMVDSDRQTDVARCFSKPGCRPHIRVRGVRLVRRQPAVGAGKAIQKGCSGSTVEHTRVYPRRTDGYTGGSCPNGLLQNIRTKERI